MPRLSRLVPALLALASALLPTGSPAQDAPPDRGVMVWIAPESGNQPITLDNIDIRIDVAGFIARTRIELVFENPNPRIMEGEFVFPLPPGLTVSGYELEVDGRMRAGVVVPKQTARVAYEDTIRQQIDPGLAELTQGNVFRTRLYPIPANGSKRIALSFEQVLPEIDRHYRYVLPLSFDAPVRRFAVHAEARDDTGTPAQAAASPDPALRFDRAGQAWVAAFERLNVQPQRELAFSIPRSGERPDLVVAIDRHDPAWRTVIAEVDTGLPEDSGQVTAPGRIALFYDASGSAHERDRERELAALARYLTKLEQTDVDLVAFRDTAEPARRFRIRNGNSEALLAAIRSLPLDGGSSYGAIDFSAVRGAQLALVIGDGLSNFGDSEPAGLDFFAGTATVYALHAAQRVDAARLASIARRGGGELLDLLQLDAEQTSDALRRRPWQLLSLHAPGAECRDLAPELPAAIGSRAIVSARCRGLGANAGLQLRFGRADEPRSQHRIETASGRIVDGALADSVHRLWAQARIAAIDSGSDAEQDAVTALATRYAVVSRYTSLLVLDRIEDYVRYRIEPPEPELRERYHRLLAAQPKPTDDPGLKQRLSRLADQWRQFRAWHEQTHAGLDAVLLPIARDEATQWAALSRGAGAKQLPGDLLRRAAGLEKHAETLVRRWPAEGGDERSGNAWRREATALMLEIDELRRERLALAPGLAIAMARQEQSERDRATGADARIVHESLPPPPPAPPIATAPATSAAERATFAAPAAPPAPAELAAALDDGSATLDRVEVTGARIAPGADANDAEPAPLRAGIQLSHWNPDTPYLQLLRKAEDPYAAYLEQRAEHGRAPAFFLDCADFFRDEAKQPALAVRVLSNLAELDVDNTALTRILGYRLAQWQHYPLAVGQFEAALEQRPEEPQSHRDLALSLARLPEPQIERAAQLLWHVATAEWHGRFPGIELIALHELNALLATLPEHARPDLSALAIPSELLDPLAIGLRVVLTWDADNTDIDLWLIDPAGDKAYYGQNRTRTGGHVSNDFTQGYGPEVYTIARPLPGTYRVQINYFGDRRQTVTGPVTVQVEFQTRFGAPDGARQSVTRRLESSAQTIDLGEFTVGR